MNLVIIEPRRRISVIYSVRVVFDRVARPDEPELDEPRRVTFEFDGVQRMTLDGGLTPKVLQHPESINWGLSEVAVVRIAPARDWVHLKRCRNRSENPGPLPSGNLEAAGD